MPNGELSAGEKAILFLAYGFLVKSKAMSAAAFCHYTLLLGVWKAGGAGEYSVMASGSSPVENLDTLASIPFLGGVLGP